MSTSQSKRRVSNGAAFMIAVMVPITIFLIVQLFTIRRFSSPRS